MIVLFDTRGLATAPPTIVAGAAIALDSNVARTEIKDGFIVRYETNIINQESDWVGSVRTGWGAN